MEQPLRSEVFTADEVARAAGVERGAVDALIASGELRLIAGTPFIRAGDAIAAGRQLALARPAPEPLETTRFVTGTAEAATHDTRRQPAMPAFASSVLHGVVIAVAIWTSAGRAEVAVPMEEPRTPERLVFLMSPGPGGGGGGGGLRSPLPAAPAQRRGTERPRVTVPAATPAPVLVARREVEPARDITRSAPPVPRPAEREPDPLPARVLVAPVVSAAPDESDRDGVISGGRGTGASAGPGTQGGAGTGQGTGNGEGFGSGIGEGAGGGTGGGPYRPGAGIEPPRLLREVKPEYTDEARRRGVTGDVLLEVVVRSDGSVGDVRILRALGAGLDQRAVAAVRQWRFSPARRQGQPVDVIVEVAVEFTLR